LDASNTKKVIIKAIESSWQLSIALYMAILFWKILSSISFTETVVFKGVSETGPDLFSMASFLATLRVRYRRV